MVTFVINKTIKNNRQNIKVNRNSMSRIEVLNLLLTFLTKYFKLNKLFVINSDLWGDKIMIKEL